MSFFSAKPIFVSVFRKISLIHTLLRKLCVIAGSSCKSGFFIMSLVVLCLIYFVRLNFPPLSLKAN